MVNVHEIQQIGVLGAGRSAGYLIEYLGGYCQSHGKTLKVYDQHFDRLKGSFDVLDSTELCEANLGDAAVLDAVISGLQLVVSVLPPTMHLEVAKACLKHGCHLFTASYTSSEMKSLGDEAEAKGLLFMNELGLDPGIDHLSASRLFEQAHQKGFAIESFESHCGGLVAKEDCGENPWQYKFTWNPTNVVLAGQGGDSIWREQGIEQHVAGMKIFANAKEIEVPGLGVFDVYPNRNSLTYEALYGLEGASTLLRGTLRRKGYCEAWNELVEMGFTNSSELLHMDCAAAWFTHVSGFADTDAWLADLADRGKSHLCGYMSFLRLNEGVEGLEVLGKTSAQVLEQILLDRWALGSDDKDEVVMVHRLGLVGQNGEKKVWYSVLQVLGEGGDRTAMAKTVGLPLAMGVETFLEGESHGVGAVVPFEKSWYQPILHKLENQGIVFQEYLG